MILLLLNLQVDGQFFYNDSPCRDVPTAMLLFLLMTLHLCNLQVDGQFFYNGSPWELKARDYAAATLNAALQELSRLGPHIRSSSSDISVSSGQEVQHQGLQQRSPLPTSAADMIAVSAMEGVGVSEVSRRGRQVAARQAFIRKTSSYACSAWLRPRLGCDL